MRVESEFRQSTASERELIDRLLDAQFPGRDELAGLLATIEVRALDDLGGLDIRSHIPGTASVVKQIPVEAEAKDDDGCTIHALLHVKNGRPIELEIFKDDGTAIRRMPPPSEFELIVLPPGPRDGDAPTEASAETCQMAIANAERSINRELRFPSNVFNGSWKEFLFFDSDWMMAPDFVESVNAFLEAEGGSCACLSKVDSDDATNPRVFAVRRQTTANEYGEVLAGTAPGYGWRDAFERLACASNVGEWCIYCEPQAEIAVIALKETNDARYRRVLDRFSASRFSDAIKEGGLSYAFSNLLPEWRSTFLREYRNETTE
jgi:hypothetical protein